MSGDTSLVIYTPLCPQCVINCKLRIDWEARTIRAVCPQCGDERAVWQTAGE